MLETLIEDIEDQYKQIKNLLEVELKTKVISCGDSIASIDSSNPFAMDTLKESISFESISSMTGNFGSLVEKLKSFQGKFKKFTKSTKEKLEKN